MFKVAITQAHLLLEERNESRDTLDIRWGTFFDELGYLGIPLMSNAANNIKMLDEIGIDAIVLSGGGDVNENDPRSQLERALLSYSKLNNIPTIGVCRGMQMINKYQGGQLVKCHGHVKTQHNVYFKQPKKNRHRIVNSYHENCITTSTLGKDLSIIAHSDDNTIECFQHKHYPWLGIMWHPERETPFSSSDLSLFKAHLERQE